MQKKCIPYVLLVIAGFVINDAKAQRRAIQRAMETRGSDSAWIFSPLFGRNRFFMGEQQVTQLEFYNRIRSSDNEVAALMDKAQARLTKGRFLEATGTVMILTGGLLHNPYSEGANKSLNNITAALVIGGAAMYVAGLFFIIPGAEKCRQGIELFNLKAKKNDLNTTGATFFFGTGNYGMGLRLHW